MWDLKTEKGIPIYVSIMELIVSNIKNGEILPGQRLPSERKLAEAFQVNRSTVVHALEELVVLGWITRKQGSGTVVNQGTWEKVPHSTINWRRYLDQTVFNELNPFIEKMNYLARNTGENILDAYTGELPLELIPTFEFPPLTWKYFLEEEHQDDLGYLPLRQSISVFTKNEYGLSLDSESLLITSGAQQALFLILQVLMHIGDSVAIEEPSFLYALPIFQASGIRLHGVKMDGNGIEIAALEKTIRQHRVKMVMVNPTFQNPTGKTMPLSRRRELVALCQKYQIPIVEDDVFGLLRFPSFKILPTLKQLDPENVLYIGSLSKILGSTTKIGWLSAPASVSQKLAEARKMMDFSLSIFPQKFANLALTDRSFSSKIIKLREELAARGAAVYQIINEMDEWRVECPEGGFYIWAKWQNGKINQKQWQLFLKNDLLIAPSFFYCENQAAIRINYARISQEELSLFSSKFSLITKQIGSNEE